MRYRLFTLLTTLIPSLTLAYGEKPTDFKSLVGIFTGIINILIPFIITLTFLTIVWGVVKTWIIGGGDTEQIEKGKKIIAVGIIALVIMVSIWGILSLLRISIFGVL